MAAVRTTVKRRVRGDWYGFAEIATLASLCAAGRGLPTISRFV
jgi:hypothetical protein